MRHFHYPIYLRTHRDRWGLTQRELAALLGNKSANVISKYERLARHPNVEALIGSEFIFGEKARRLFPELYSAVELGITRRAAHLAEGLVGDETRDALAKRELLDAIAMRAANDHPSI